MESLLTENRLSINEAARQLNKAPSTLWRWCLRGVKNGIKLENFSLGGQRFTTQESLDRFSDRCTAAGSGERPQHRTARRRQIEIDRAESELAKAGI